jgi:hypothetical protein
MNFVLPSWIFGEQSGVLTDYSCFHCQYHYTSTPSSYYSYQTDKREKPRNNGWKSTLASSFSSSSSYSSSSSCCRFLNLIYFFVIKPTRCTNFTNLFWYENLHVSDSSSVHHQEFIHCTLSNGMSYKFVDNFRAGPGWSCSSILVLLESCMTYTIAECTVDKLLMMDKRTIRNM